MNSFAMSRFSQVLFTENWIDGLSIHVLLYLSPIVVFSIHSGTVVCYDVGFYNMSRPLKDRPTVPVLTFPGLFAFMFCNTTVCQDSSCSIFLFAYQG